MRNHVFSDCEGIRIAVEIEKRGCEFYKRAADIARSETMRALLSELAADEQRHISEFSRLADENLCDETPYDAETNAYLSAVAADVVFTDGLMGLLKTGLNSPADVLNQSILSEKDSILFYFEMALRTDCDRARDIFQHIIGEEKKHLARLQKMLAELKSI